MLFRSGDVKQSIYKFRMARPEIFVEKYNSYVQDACSTRIDLSQNFRSRTQVIAFVNDIFRPLMRKEVGGIIYDDNAALDPGMSFATSEAFEPELLLYSNASDTGQETMPDAKGEACMIAKRIQELVQTGTIKDEATEGQRPIQYKDIVVLVRSTSGLMEELKTILQTIGVPANIPSKTGYFAANEVRILLD